MPCHSQWITVHLSSFSSVYAVTYVFLQLYLKLAVHVSFPELFSGCSSVAIFFHGFVVVLVVVLVWQCSHYFMCLSPFHFLLFDAAQLSIFGHSSLLLILSGQ